MKKTAVFSLLFLAAFVVTAGITVLSGTVSASIPCPSPVCISECTTDTGPLCTLPARPNYAYAIECFCPHPGAHHEVPSVPFFSGCCNAGW